MSLSKTEEISDVLNCGVNEENAWERQCHRPNALPAPSPIHHAEAAVTSPQCDGVRR